MNSNNFFTSKQAWAQRKYALARSRMGQCAMAARPSLEEFYSAYTVPYPICYEITQSGHLGLGHSEDTGSSGLKLVGIPPIPPEATGMVDSLGRELALKPAFDPPTGTSAIMGERRAMYFVDLQSRPRLPSSIVETILGRREPGTEIIVNFDAESIWREAANRCAIRCAGTASCRDLVNEGAKLLGLDVLKDTVAIGPGAALVSNYMGMIADYDFRVVAYQIRDELNLPTNSYLIYCTRDRENVRSMNNVIRATEDYLLAEYCKGLKVPLWDSSLCTDGFLRRQELRQLALSYAERVTPVLKSALRWQLLFERFGEFYESDYDSVFAETIGGRNEGE